MAMRSWSNSFENGDQSPFRYNDTYFDVHEVAAKHFVETNSFMKS